MDRVIDRIVFINQIPLQAHITVLPHHTSITALHRAVNNLPCTSGPGSAAASRASHMFQKSGIVNTINWATSSTIGEADIHLCSATTKTIDFKRN